MLCAARAEVGPLGQCFWVLWDRERAAASSTTPRCARAAARSSRRAAARDRRPRPARRACASARSAPIESICPSGSGWGWTRKRAGMPIDGHGRDAGRRRCESTASASTTSRPATRPRHTSWHWSAGVGDARPTAAPSPGTWSRASTTRPSAASAAIWIDGEPSRAGPGQLRRPRRDPLRRRLPPRLRRRVPSAPATTTSSSSAPATATASAPSAGALDGIELAERPGA